MPRSWDDLKPSARCYSSHPLLSFSAELAKITNANLSPDSTSGCKKPVLSLAVGDPALDGNLPAPNTFMDALEAHVASGQTNGYTLSIGTVQARQAVADYWFRHFVSDPSEKQVTSSSGSSNADTKNSAKNTLFTSDDVVLTSGCSDGLNIVFAALANEGDILLFPQPFFAQYDVSARYYGILPEYYDLVAERNWEVDLPGLEALVKHTRESAPQRAIRGVLLNNPSNPCGSNWSYEHVRDIVRLCERLQLPVISDEIYAGMVYNIHEADGVSATHASAEAAGTGTKWTEAAPSLTVRPRFTSVANITDSCCMRFIVSGASKRFSVPGERFGWVLRMDEVNGERYRASLAPSQTGGAAAASSFSPSPNDSQSGSSSKTSPTQVAFNGMKKLCARYLIPMTALQAAMADCLANETPEQTAYYERARVLLRDNAKYLFEELSKIDALTPIEPQGGMFMSVFLNFEKLEPSVRSDADFANALAREENVHVFPGEPFRMPSALRLVLSRPLELNKDVVERLRGFCQRHSAGQQ